jgi:DNA repair exonuclease SbcCD ATPase subunit
MVENKMLEKQEDQTQFKKWYIRNIEFSNFLSYGENQRLDFDNLNGIVVIESNPPNFGGKTVLSVDLLMFLFFNETTKTTKAEEIFNRFTDKNKVVVKGEVTIDGEDYIIIRTIERKLSKKGDWNVKTELDFFKKLSDGSLQNFQGEQRRETEAFIKSSIGTKEDFLMTILTTATNLEELLEAKPTARGQVLSRFMGLEFLKTKEETAKEVYSEFSKSKMSNVYSSEQLKGDNEDLKTKIVELNNQIDEVKKEFTNHLVLDDRVNFVKGDITQTLLNDINVPDKISILRLDTDWYESTKLELEILYKNLVSGGFLIIDDYGYWQGCKKAVDEFFGNDFVENNFKKLDNTGIMFRKP